MSMKRPMMLMLATVSAVLAAFGPGCGRSFLNPADSEDDMIKFGNYSNGRFTNSEPTNVMKPGTVWNASFQYLFGGHAGRTPPNPLPIAAKKEFASAQASTGLRFIWLGHSSVFIELGGKRILIDPMFSERASFISWAGPKQFQPAPLQAWDLPSLGPPEPQGRKHHCRVLKRDCLLLVRRTRKRASKKNPPDPRGLSGCGAA